MKIFCKNPIQFKQFHIKKIDFKHNMKYHFHNKPNPQQFFNSLQRKLLCFKILFKIIKLGFVS